mgnify:CR=1 FL=1
MFDIIETLESYKIDLAEEGIKDSLSGVGNKLKENKIIGAVIKFIHDRIDGLKKRLSALGARISNMRTDAKVEKITNKQALKYVDMALKGAKMINGSVKAVSGAFKSGKNFDSYATNYINKINDYAASMTELSSKIDIHNLNDIYSPRRCASLQDAIGKGIADLENLAKNVEATLKAKLAKKRSYDEEGSSAVLTRYVNFIKKSAATITEFLKKSQTIVFNCTKSKAKAE